MKTVTTGTTVTLTTGTTSPTRTRVVWKYALAIGPVQSLPLAGAIVHVGVQGTFPMLWVENDGSRPVLRDFQVFGTGWPIPDGWQHRGTVQDGDFVWHVYERVPS